MKHAGWDAVVHVLRSPLLLFNDVIATVVPATCRLCAAPLERVGSVPVCEFCLQATVPTDTIGCAICGKAAELAIDMEDLLFARSVAEQILCRECRLAPPAYVRAVSFATYANELRGLIALFKFNRIRGMAKLLGPKLAAAILQLEGVAGGDLLVVPVPLFRARERERGFNQSRLLAEEALRYLRRVRPDWRLVPAFGALVRQRSTESSFGLSRSGRRRNLAGAFRIAADVRGREVLLVDDVLTTGATARECARVLVRAGASRVFVATLARSQEGSVRRQHEQMDEVAAWDMAASSSTIRTHGTAGG